MELLAIVIAFAAMYFAGAFVSAKILGRDQWPFTAEKLD